MKRIVSLMMVFFVGTLSLLGCQQQDTSSKDSISVADVATNESNNDNNGTVEADDYELTVLMETKSWGGTDEPKMGEAFKAYAEQQLGIKIDMIAPPHNSYNERLNVLLVSGEKLDVIKFQGAPRYIPGAITKGQIMPLNDYMKKNSIISEHYEKFPNYYEEFSADGLVYGLPMARPAGQYIWARKDIFDKHNVNIPRTTDEFVTEMSKFKGTGIVPFTFPKWIVNMQYFFNSFDAYLGLAQDSQGKWYDGFNTDEMKEALVWLNSIYEQGILDPEFMVNENKTMREKQWAGKAASYLYWDSLYGRNQREGLKTDANTENIAIPYLVGPNGQAQAFNCGINDAFAIGNKSERPEMALDFIEWLLYTSEGQIANKLGVEGISYEVKEGKYSLTSEGEAAGYPALPGFGKSLPDMVLPFEVEMDQSEKTIHEEEQKIVAEMASIAMNKRYIIPAGVSNTYDTRVNPEYETKSHELIIKVIMGEITLDECYERWEKFSKAVDIEKALSELNQ